MTSDSLTSIFLNACIVNNFVLSLFLGICPFLGVSGKRETALRMGLAVMFVMLISSACAYGINNALVRLEMEYLRLICYIAVIASAVQLVEMFMKKVSPPLFRTLGIYLPLITTNCAILGLALFQTAKEYNFLQCLIYALGAGAGFSIALVIMAGLREQLELADVPGVAQGAALSLMLAGILSLAFMGFAGQGS
ncbi:MAG TPA: RnfABCDGE type electron transport complex subunit A [Gammaproteobacteria bacterium]|jgi:electron transport complex protein RnfA|nr:RnfABCDGE type electron transport complex subunit A [Candidatus Hydrogenedentota bacterium]HJP35624.1 RnfABCDGE type electron transport complex subunit A [Gammaproteobacteria bacterium]